jgi:hypothetical protein
MPVVVMVIATIDALSAPIVDQNAVCGYRGLVPPVRKCPRLATSPAVATPASYLHLQRIGGARYLEVPRVGLSPVRWRDCVLSVQLRQCHHSIGHMRT